MKMETPQSHKEWHYLKGLGVAMLEEVTSLPVPYLASCHDDNELNL